MSSGAAQVRRAIAGAMICQMGLGLGGYVFAAFLKPIVSELGWSRTAFSVSSLPFLTAMAFASPLVGAATDRLGPRRIFAAGILVVAAALVGLSGIGFVVDRVGLRRATLATFGALSAGSGLLLAIAAVPELRPLFLTVHGATVAAENVLLPLIVVACFGARHMPAIYGALMVALLPGGVAGPVVSARSYDVLGSYGPAFAAFAGANLLALAGLVWISSKSWKRAVDPRVVH